MKNIFTVIVLFNLISVCSSAQTAPIPGLSPKQKAGYEKMINSIDHPAAYYTLSDGNKWRYDIGTIKARSLKTKAWILVAAGAALGGAGFLIPNKGSDYTKPAFFGVGAAAIATGIICFTIVKKRKKELGLILSNPPPTVGTPATSFFRPQPGLRYNF